MLDPVALLAAEESASSRGLEVIGVWHSHPDRAAVPSEEDRAAAWPKWSYLIASVNASGVRDLRSWRLGGEAFVEEAVRLKT
ncbi:MAG: M67 family metallopeptidase [Planctomycetota bacterium]